MNIVLDTSILIELENGNKNVINKLEELKKLYPAPPKISFISYFEFLYGLRNKSIKNKDKSLAFLNRFSIISITKNTANFLVNFKQKYELPLADLLIAAQVEETNGVLVTKDNDFNMIEEIEKSIILN